MSITYYEKEETKKTKNGNIIVRKLVIEGPVTQMTKLIHRVDEDNPVMKEKVRQKPFINCFGVKIK